MVESIEKNFVPVCILNNEGGADLVALDRFVEPAWNNPVVRFVDAAGKDLIPRKDGVYDAPVLASRAVMALSQASTKIPGPLALLASSAHRDRFRRAVLEMHCFWVGQAKLGGLSGVQQATPAFLGSTEVLDLVYDPAVLTTEALVEAAIRFECARSLRFETDEEVTQAKAVGGDRVKKSSDRPKVAPASDQLHALRRSPWRTVPMTELQALRVNAVLAAGGDPSEWVTERQKSLFAKSRTQALSDDATPRADWNGDIKALEDALKR